LVHITEDDKFSGSEREEAQDTGVIKYEALSWRWGDETKGLYIIMIKKYGEIYKKRVSETLGLALKYLRGEKDRILWINAICIDQQNRDERSSQVAMMSLVYTGATQVCVWLGEDDEESTMAIKFVRDEITLLKNLDRLCTDKQHATKWGALLGLMQRDWFSRRWVSLRLSEQNSTQDVIRVKYSFEPY